MKKIKEFVFLVLLARNSWEYGNSVIIFFAYESRNEEGSGIFDVVSRWRGNLENIILQKYFRDIVIFSVIYTYSHTSIVVFVPYFPRHFMFRWRRNIENITIAKSFS